MNIVALDGDKLKPRTNPDAGGNGFGVNEDGAGYTLTAVDRHGVAYAADGGEVAATITRQIAEQSGQDNRANSVVQCFEDHGQDCRIKPIEVSDTRNRKDGTGGNNLPLVVQTTTPFVKTAHACGKDGLGEKWEQCEVAGTRNAIEGGDGRNQECIVHTAMAQNTRDEVRVVGDGNIAGALAAQPGMKQQTYVVSANSNGVDIAPTLDHKTGPANGIGAQNNKRGGYVIQQQVGGGGVLIRQEPLPSMTSAPNFAPPCNAPTTKDPSQS